MTEQSNYTEDNIRSLDWKEHIRMRPGMYIGKLGDGSSPDDGIYILLKEVLDNSIDEYVMGAGKTIDINVNPIKTGIKAIDNMALMEVAWYGRQLHRISKGQNPKPNENAFVAFIKVMLTTVFRTSRTKRLRAKA